MADALLRIKRSGVNGNPSSLHTGELAYSWFEGEGGNRLYIGTGTETNGNAVNHVVIGGKFFTDMLDHQAGVLTASSALIVDENKKINQIITPSISNNGDLTIEGVKTIVKNLYVDEATTLQAFVDSRVTSGQLTVNAGEGIEITGEGKTKVISLTTTGVVAKDYGSATKVPVLSVDAQGRITGATEAEISTSLGVTDGTTEGTVDLLSGKLSIKGESGVKVALVDQTFTATIDETAVVKTTGAQSIAGTKTFTEAPKIGAETATTKEYVDAQIPEVITSKVGTELQAHSDQLDKLSALSDVGFISREADGSVVGFGIEAGDASVTVTKDDTAKKVKVALPSVGTAGSYFKVTTDAQGRVTAGENPTTVDGFGITDAVKKTGDTLTGKLTYQGVDLATLGENDLVPKVYADSVALGYDVHVACETGSNTNIQGTYTDGTVNPNYVGVGATLTLESNITAIGGVKLTVGQRVLLVGQTDKKQNGAYSVKSLAPVVLERVEDFDGHPTISYKGASFLIADGDLKGTVWRLMNNGTIVFGTDDINFAQAFAPNSIKAGDGIAVSGTTVSVKQGSTVRVIGGNLEVSSGTGNTGKILTAGADGTTAQWKAIETSDLPQNVVLTDAEQTITNKTISAKTVSITDTTDSTSASTGALTVAGGVGIAHDLHIGGNIVGSGTTVIEGVILDMGEY